MLLAKTEKFLTDWYCAYAKLKRNSECYSKTERDLVLTKFVTAFNCDNVLRYKNCGARLETGFAIEIKEYIYSENQASRTMAVIPSFCYKLLHQVSPTCNIFIPSQNYPVY